MVAPPMTASAKKTPRTDRALLDRERWVEAGLSALIRGGLGAVSVERTAKALGVTKGSFYWHFKNRDALVAALAARWEQLGAELVIQQLEAISDPRARLEALLNVSFDDVQLLRAEASLSAAAAHGDPTVTVIVARVMRRRLAYTEGLYRALGTKPAEAKRMAVVAYGAYLGAVQLAAQGLLPTGKKAQTAQRDTLRRMLVVR